jgi:hypothetical protein
MPTAARAEGGGGNRGSSTRVIGASVGTLGVGHTGAAASATGGVIRDPPRPAAEGDAEQIGAGGRPLHGLSVLLVRYKRSALGPRMPAGFSRDARLERGAGRPPHTVPA